MGRGAGDGQASAIPQCLQPGPFLFDSKGRGGIGLRPNIFLVNLYNKRVQSISSSSACFPRPRGHAGRQPPPPDTVRRRCQCDSSITAPGVHSLARPAVFTIPGSSPLSRSKHGKSGAAQPSESLARRSLLWGHRSTLAAVSALQRRGALPVRRTGLLPPSPGRPQVLESLLADTL